MGHAYSPAWRKVSIIILRPLIFSMMKRDWHGRDNVPRDGGLIVAMNHLSWSDPFSLSHYVYKAGRYPVYLAKSALFEVKYLGAILRKLGQIPVYRDTTDAALALRDAEQGLRDGQCLMFFPEGTVTRDPDLWPMRAKTGAARLALSTGAPVVPIAHWGEHKLWPYGTKKFRPFPYKTMHVKAGPPVDLSKYEGKPLNNETLHAATEDIMRAIADLLGDLRGEKAPDKLWDPKAKAVANKGEAGRARAS